MRPPGAASSVFLTLRAGSISTLLRISRAALLNHLIELNRVSEFQTATGFTFELCDRGQQAERRDRLI
jgi:hypothetical protein